LVHERIRPCLPELAFTLLEYWQRTLLPDPDDLELELELVS